MARNSSGTMSAPGSYPPVADTVISLDDFKALVQDILNELTDSLSRSSKGGMLAALKLADGTQALPGLSFNNEAGTGLFRSGAGDLRAAVQGALIAKLTAAGLSVTGAVTASGDVSGATVAAPAVKADAFTPRAAAVPVIVKGDGAKLFSVAKADGTEEAYFDAGGKLFLTSAALDVVDLLTPRRVAGSLISGTTNSTAKVPVPKSDNSGSASVTITTRGRPVTVALQPASSAASWIGVTGSTGSYALEIEIVRDGAVIATIQQGAGPRTGPSVISCQDMPGAGAHTYSLNWVLTNGGMSGTIQNCQIVATEL